MTQPPRWPTVNQICFQMFSSGAYSLSLYSWSVWRRTCWRYSLSPAVNRMVAYPGLGSYAQAGGLPSGTALASEAGGTGQWRWKVPCTPGALSHPEELGWNPA